jgi:hypothetical protein
MRERDAITNAGVESAEFLGKLQPIADASSLNGWQWIEAKLQSAGESHEQSPLDYCGICWISRSISISA